MLRRVGISAPCFVFQGGCVKGVREDRSPPLLYAAGRLVFANELLVLLKKAPPCL